jgi:predicted XRE-type DNA-binding protein
MIESPAPDIKRRLAEAIVELASQTNFFVAARGLGIGEARLSDLRHGRAERFTIDRLVKILAKVNRRVDVSITVVGGWTQVDWWEGRFPPRPDPRRPLPPRREVSPRKPLAKSGKRR